MFVAKFSLKYFLILPTLSNWQFDVNWFGFFGSFCSLGDRDIKMELRVERECFQVFSPLVWTLVTCGPQYNETGLLRSLQSISNQDPQTDQAVNFEQVCSILF